MRTGPVNVHLSQRKKIGTVNLKRSKTTKNRVVLSAIKKVVNEMCKNTKTNGIAAKASTKKNLGFLETSRQ